MIMTIEKLKEKLLENIVFVVTFVAGFIYLLVKGELSELGFIIAFPPWFVFSSLSFSALLDWKIPKDFKDWIFVSFIAGLFSTALLFYIGWRENLYFLVIISVMLGLMVSVVNRIFSKLK